MRALDGRTDGLNSRFKFFSFYLNLPKKSKLSKICFLASLVSGQGEHHKIKCMEMVVTSNSLK